MMKLFFEAVRSRTLAHLENVRSQIVSLQPLGVIDMIGPQPT